MKKYIAIVFALLALTACESLEDTYKEFAGDGPIRYLGKCSDLTIQPGWNRLMVSWTNSPDPVIDKIKVTWTKDGVVNEELVDRGVSEFNITGLEDGNYEVTVCSVDKDGVTSLPATQYGRPYTANHEMVQSFTRIVSNHYFIGDRLILLFQGWEDNVNEAHITYTRADGSQGQVKLDEALVNSLYYLVPDRIDTSRPVELYRSGTIPGCDDEIVFAPSPLEDEKLFNADFKQEMKRQYGFDEDIPATWASTVEEICFDRTIGSFVDLFNLPNIKKVILGKHRYIRSEMVDDAETAQSKIYDVALSDFVLRTLSKLRPGFVVERYNKHYSSLAQGDYLKEMGMPEVETHDYYSLAGLKFTSTPADAGSYKSYLEYLTDGSDDTSWEPDGARELTTYTLDLDLNGEKTLHGLRLAQTYYTNVNKRSWCPSIVRIFVSDDGENWHTATYLEELEIGASTGEISVIPFTGTGLTASWLRVIVSTPYSESTYNVSLAELSIY